VEAERLEKMLLALPVNQMEALSRFAMIYHNTSSVSVGRESLANVGLADHRCLTTVRSMVRARILSILGWRSGEGRYFRTDRQLEEAIDVLVDYIDGLFWRETLREQWPVVVVCPHAQEGGVRRASGKTCEAIEVSGLRF